MIARAERDCVGADATAIARTARALIRERLASAPLIAVTACADAIVVVAQTPSGTGGSCANGPPATGNVAIGPPPITPNNII